MKKCIFFDVADINYIAHDINKESKISGLLVFTVVHLCDY
ncbi:hypothetical protein CSB69_0828 [Morganella morganii]|nr:hypothetical protein CSB69_0828 [Morganella morganii]